MKKNGFTLIELLAVIVILAIVLLIAVPAIGNVIEKSKKDTFESSAKGLIDAAKYFHSKNILSLETDPYVFSFNDGKKGEAVINEQTYKLAYNGQAPSGGNLTLRDDGKIELYVCNDTYCACKSYDSVVVSIVNTEVENCGLNEDGTVADNPIFSNELEDLKTDFAASQEELATLKDAFEESQDNFLDKTYPVGSIYMSKNNTNPGTIFGGTWVTYGTGRTLVGVDTTQSEFNIVEKTGGEKTHILSVAEMPSHTHIQNSHNHTQNSHNHTQNSHNHTQNPHNHDVILGGVPAKQGIGGVDGSYFDLTAESPYIRSGDRDFDTVQVTATNNATTATNNATTATNNATTATNQNTGGDGSHNNLQPYITVYMWKRTN